MSASSKKYAEVALNVPLEATFHYRIPEPLREPLEPGMRVRVPFGRREMVGVCVGFSKTTSIEESRIKELIGFAERQQMFDPQMLELTRWMAGYYCCGWGEALDAVLPSGVKRRQAARTILMAAAAHKPAELRAAAEELDARAPRQARVLRALAGLEGEITAADLIALAQVDHSVLQALRRDGWLTLRKEKLAEDPSLEFRVEHHAPPALTPEQRSVLRRLDVALDAGKFHVALLHGVTGSGKTEVYLQALKRVVESGRQGIVLVPEIALTPQTVARFKARFDRVCVLHSELTEKGRRDQWLAIRDGRADVVIGARSAVFAPVPKLGLIVVDEEHENSFKQESVPRYHGRDVGIWRARQENALVILGSATPSLESLHNARAGKYELLELPRRVEGRPLPPVEILDLGQESAKGKAPMLSRRLKLSIESALKNGEQVILFLNRRGFNTQVSCPNCGFTLKCDQCAVSMTFHRGTNKAVCHYCAQEVEPPQICPGCNTGAIKYRGVGTERVEEEVARLFGAESVARMDRDAMRGRGAYEKLLEEFRDGKTKILLGTQMVAKGLDFPNVTLVGVINADIIMNLPDFRAAERTFQLLAQVAGRAGRGKRGGRVIIQTFNPEHPCIRDARTHDYHSFAKRELAARRECNYPPFSRLARLIFEGKDAAAVESRCAEAVTAMRKAVSKQSVPLSTVANTASVSRGKACLAPTTEHYASTQGQSVQILGPAAAPIERIKGLWRWHALVKAPDSALLHLALSAVERKHGPVRLSIDVDPVAML